MNDNAPESREAMLAKARIRFVFMLVVISFGASFLVVFLLPKIVYIAPLDMNKVATLQSNSPLHQMGSLPADICVIDGAPQVLNLNHDLGYGDSEATLTYLRNNGDLVVLTYWTNGLRDTKETFVWSGGHCGAKASQ